MAETTRIKGQEVQVLIVRAGVVEDSLTFIQDLNVSFVMEIKSQGYLGEKFDRQDDIYKNVKGDCEFNTASPDWTTFVQAIIDRQQRKTPDVVFNITATFFYPSGKTRAGLLPDVKFGELPISIGNRGEYVKHKLQFATEEIQFFDV